jgi:hypothetical protein
MFNVALGDLQRALRHFAHRRRTSGDRLTSKLWEVLLKALMGVAHDLLTPPAASGDLADQLCTSLLRVLACAEGSCGSWFGQPSFQRGSFTPLTLALAAPLMRRGFLVCVFASVYRRESLTVSLPPV